MKDTYQIIAEYYNSRGFLIKKEIFNDPETSIPLSGLDEDAANKHLSLYSNLYFGKTVEIDNQKCYYCFSAQKVETKKYRIKKLTWTEVEKNEFVSNWFNSEDNFRIYKSGSEIWILVQRIGVFYQDFDSKEEAIEEANEKYQEIAKEFLEEVEN